MGVKKKGTLGDGTYGAIAGGWWSLVREREE